MEHAATLDTQFPSHLATIGRHLDAGLERLRLQGAVVHAGGSLRAFQDDQCYPYRANPWFLWLAPLTEAPDSLIIWRRGEKPRLILVIPDDYWHLPPEPPTDPWVTQFALKIVSSAEQTLACLPPDGTDWAWLGEPTPPAGFLANPPELLRALEDARCRKSPYEVTCLAEATRRGVAGHRAAWQAFRERQAEHGIHLAFLAGSGMTEAELPYPSIVGLNEHASTLHYQRRDREPPARPLSLLIDAGAAFRGYASDITRSYAVDGGSAFGHLLAGMQALQQSLCRQVRPGIDWPELHLAAHHGVASLLREAGVIRVDAAAAVASGLSGYFLPHGLGHLLGLQVHDIGGFRPTPDADPLPPPPGHPWLRLTRRLEPGFVVTVEPGVYFIPSLLAKLRASALARQVDWSLVDELAPCGGIRIEDNVLVTADGHRNLTREETARSGIAAA